jgi:hypothetical protein
VRGQLQRKGTTTEGPTIYDCECNHNLVHEGYSDDEIGREMCVLLALQKTALSYGDI